MKARTVFTVLATLVMGGAMLTAPIPSQAQVKKQGSKYLFRIKWQKGKKYNYSMTTTTTMPGADKPMVQGGSISMLVKSVSNGTATVETTTNGMGSSGTQTMKVDSRGKTVEVQGASGYANEFAQFPANAVAIGDKWTVNSSPMQGMNVKATNTLKGFKTINGKQYAHINSQMTISGQFGGTGKADTLIDMADGMNLRSTINMKANVDTGNGQKMNLDLAIKLERK
ncbi:MAG: hypothetical protein KDC26_00460 [Armatimonadetes bacterium]|nr:hypothetical protein [Armatimonadota bacterium]